ncbi:HAD family hydrolase [Haloarchaeobius sp. HRN-SO-5]|uniref:HAD family hydrolase n=1 Tax=Haloarchaeobius sp. HRN-SO-5 TaxID=3446118 RepID=UPI003EB8500D
MGFYESLFAATADRTDAGEVPTRELAHAHVDCVDHSAVTFRDGARRALEHARETAAQVGLVTNGGEASQTTKLEALDIADAFDVTVFVDPANGVEPKPHPAPFERALARLDADSAETVHVGDSLRADVGGANASGIDSVWVPYDEASHAGDHEPTHHIESMAAFPSLF